MTNDKYNLLNLLSNRREFFLATVALGLLLWGFKPEFYIKRSIMN